MQFAERVTVRAKGLAITIQFEHKNYVEKIAARSRRAGLIFSAESDTILLLPALTIDKPNAKSGLDILEDCV